MTTVPIGTTTMRVRPAGLTERIAAGVGMRALRWAGARAAARERDAVAAIVAHERALERRERDWSRLGDARPR